MINQKKADGKDQSDGNQDLDFLFEFKSLPGAVSFDIEFMKFGGGKPTAEFLRAFRKRISGQQEKRRGRNQRNKGPQNPQPKTKYSQTQPKIAHA